MLLNIRSSFVSCACMTENTVQYLLAGSGSRGGLFGTATPTAMPSFADRGFDTEGDINNNNNDTEQDNNNNNDAAVDREVAAAQKLMLSGGSAGVVAVAVVTMTTLAMAVAGVLLS